MEDLTRMLFILSRMVIINLIVFATFILPIALFKFCVDLKLRFVVNSSVLMYFLLLHIDIFGKHIKCASPIKY